MTAHYGYGTIGHTSSHHAFLGGYADGKPPVFDPAKRGGRIIINPDPDKMCGRCEAIVAGLDPASPKDSTLPPDQRQRAATEMEQSYRWLAWHHDPAALHALRCWLELSKPIGGQR